MATHPVAQKHVKVEAYPNVDCYESPLGVPRNRFLEVEAVDGMLTIWVPEVGKPGWCLLTLNQRCCLKFYENEEFPAADTPYVGMFYVPEPWGLGSITVGEVVGQEGLPCGCSGPWVVVRVNNNTELDAEAPDMHCLVHTNGLDINLLEEMKALNMSGEYTAGLHCEEVILDGKPYDKLFSAGALVTTNTARQWDGTKWQTWGTKPDIFGRFVDSEGCTRVWESVDGFEELTAPQYYIGKETDVVARINGWPGGVSGSGFGEHAVEWALETLKEKA